MSRLLYTYLDPLIYKANLVEHLPVDQLPPLPEYDQAKYMVARNLAESSFTQSDDTLTKIVAIDYSTIRVQEKAYFLCVHERVPYVLRYSRR